MRGYFHSGRGEQLDSAERNKLERARSGDCGEHPLPLHEQNQP